LSIKKIEEYKKIEKHVYKTIEDGLKKKGEVNFEEAENTLLVKQELLKQELLDIEINLQDALLVSKKMFTAKVASIIEEMRDLIRIYINNDVLIEIEQFNNKFYEAALQEMDRFYACIDNPDIDHDDLEKDFEKSLIEILAISSREDTTGVL